MNTKKILLRLFLLCFSMIAAFFPKKSIPAACYYLQMYDSDGVVFSGTLRNCATWSMNILGFSGESHKCYYVDSAGEVLEVDYNSVDHC